LVKEGGRLALDFDGTSDFMTASGFGTGAERSVFNILKGTADPASGYANYWMFLESASPEILGDFMQVYSADFDASFNGNFLTNGLDISATVGLQNQSLTTLLKSTSASNLYKDGVSIGSGSGTQSLEDELSIGRFDANYAPQLQQEFIVYNSEKSSVRTDIEGNISAYYQSAKLLDESFGSGAEAAYSTRQLRREQTECMVIRRASDSTTTTIGFDASGNISEADIETFCTGTTCTVYQWLDQSGNGNTATAADSSKRPTIFTGGALVKDNGKVAILFDGVNNHFFSDNNLTGSVPMCFLSVANISAATFAEGLNSYMNASNDGYETRMDTSGEQIIFASNASDIEKHVAKQSQFLTFANQNASTQLFSVSGNATTISNSATISVTADFGIATRNPFASNTSWNGFIQESIVFSSDKSAVRTSIEENVGDYFTQNTPLLDTYSGAAAAYSLRLLDSTYTGSAIRVRRSSDNAEQDIGFNVFGELDTVSLLAFAGTGDAFVKVWYDQASTNDATQTNTANQPKIVSSGAVIVENGKPAVDFDGVNDGLSFTSTGYNINNLSSFVVARQFGTANGMVFAISGSTGNARWYAPFGVNTHDFGYGSSATAIQATRTANQSLFTMIAGSTQGDCEAWVNATSAGTTALVSASTSTQSGIGYFNGSFAADCTIQEVVFWSADESSNRTNIETNINTFYNIY
jgi:hypothetical protein